MARKKKKQRFSATKAVKAAAREQVGAPPPTRSIPSKRKPREEKHKPTLGDLLAES